VIRGEDHLSNTPKHIEIFRALGATPPHYAHIPLILNRNGSKMSKRDEGARISSYIQQGFVPEAVRNYLCLLGWSPKDNREKIDIDEVIKIFELEDVNRRNAAFDLNKCFWLNDQYIAQMSLDRFIELARPFIEKAGINISDEEYFRAVMSVVKEKIKLLGDVPEKIRSTEDSRQLGTSGYSGYSGRVTRGYSGSGVSGYSGYFFTEDYEFDPAVVDKVLKKPFALENLSALRSAFAALEKWDAQSLEITLKMVAGVREVKTGDLVHPARVAVSGRSIGPSLYHMLEVMGKERVLSRFDRALAMF
jgi:glutamyl/glutaminyl-tRNA synthetase